MPTFFLNLLRDSQAGRLIAECTVRGASNGFQPCKRTFVDEAELIKVLSGVGISQVRYQPVLDAVRSGAAGSFEIKLNEAQKLDVLHIDSPE